MDEPPFSIDGAVSERTAPRFSDAVVQYFHSHSPVVTTVEGLAAAISDQHDDTQREIGIELHHTTLPKLADTGFIDYDERTLTVRYRGDGLGGPSAEELEG